MDVREKLVELIDNAEAQRLSTALCCTVDEFIDISRKEEYVAEYLVAHGVTVQEWISVDERLPENFISVLGCMTDAGEFPTVRECYTVGNVFFFPALGDIHPVSHWCEMPQPPKGE